MMSNQQTFPPWRDSSMENEQQNLHYCPCNDQEWQRHLQDSSSSGELWQIIYVCFVLLFMFVALISDRVGADMVMITALTAVMAPKIISIEEGLEGFSNEGLLTVLVLFVVAEGISKTGALDWYMGKLLGRPKTVASAQLRLMVPIAVVSAFLNNTPVVAVMIPIVQRWGKNNGISPQQLLIPLSFASILGGTCTLIGTSTNLVVVGLLDARYPDENVSNIGLFDLGQYGVPVMLCGIAYILFASPYLLPGAKQSRNSTGGANPLEDEHILLGARLTEWSPAAGRSVKRSGLRDTGGIYLVSVHRAATGNVHRAVGQEFVLNVGDVLYFTGLVEGFGDFCEEHGLEVVTNEVEEEVNQSLHGGGVVLSENENNDQQQNGGEQVVNVLKENDQQQQQQHEEAPIPKVIHSTVLATVAEEQQHYCVDDLDQDPVECGITKESLLQSDEAERLRSINRMTDLIREGQLKEKDISEEPTSGPTALLPKRHSRKRQTSSVLPFGDAPPKIVVTQETRGSLGLVVVGINAKDRAGLLLDISKGLLRLDLQLHHTEAAVVGERSVSIWRCEAMEHKMHDIEEIWSVLSALLESDSGIEAIKRRGIRVIRSIVTKYSRLVGKTAAEVDFRNLYKAAIVAVQKGGKNTTQQMSSVRFDVGDVLILQASDDSPLLSKPPEDFYKTLAEGEKTPSRSSSVRSLVKLVSNRFSKDNLRSMDDSRNLSSPPTPERVPSIDRQASMEEGFFIASNETDEEVVAIPDGNGVVDFDAMDITNEDDMRDEETELAWKDLEVVFAEENDSAKGGAREFLTAMQVAPNSQLVGKTVTKLNIDKLPDVFLVSIERPVGNADEETKTNRANVVSLITDTLNAGAGTSDVDGSSMHGSSLHEADPVFITITPDEPLKAHDVLWFSGSASAVGDLRKIPGLKSFQNAEVMKMEEKVHDRRLVQAVVARQGPLVGKTVRDVRFRTRYGAAVIAVHREGSRVHDHPGQVKLQAGDVLLLEAGPTFIQRSAENDKSFALLSEVEDSAPPRLRLLIPALVIAVGMLIFTTAGVAPLLICSLVAAILMVILGILTQQEARDAINWEIYVTIASAFGIGTALTNSGVAGGVAEFLVDVGEAIGMGDAGLFGAVYFATFLISNVVTNNAAAALLFPIAMDAAEQSGASRLLMSYCLMLGASASFMSPFGYTTNLLIYGPGGYKYKDFLLIGTPMQIVLWILSVALLSVTQFPWYASWVVTFLLLFFTASWRITGQLFNCRKQPVEEDTETEEESSKGGPFSRFRKKPTAREGAEDANKRGGLFSKWRQKR